MTDAERRAREDARMRAAWREWKRMPEGGIGPVILSLAQRFGRSCQEVRRVVGRRRGTPS